LQNPVLLGNRSFAKDLTGLVFTDPAATDLWHEWLFNPVTNLLILLKLTHGICGYLTQSQNLLILLKPTRGTGGYLTRSQIY
jgi:hypothetical protein